MKFKVIWTNTAMSDLEAIIEYIASDNINNALKILDEVKQKVSKLTVFPQRGRIIPELKDYNIWIYREVIYNPWRIIYKIDERIVSVIAVLDSRRNIEDLLLDRVLRNID